MCLAEYLTTTSVFVFNRIFEHLDRLQSNTSQSIEIIHLENKMYVQLRFWHHDE